jgi:4-hydroxymandelate oxidase
VGRQLTPPADGTAPVDAARTLPVTLADYAEAARERLDPAAWAYLDGGAADGITQQANRAAWDRITLWPRVLQPLAGGHTRTELLGRTLAHPVLLAPVAYQRLAHPHGEAASALAAATQRAGVVLSAQSSVLLEDVARLVLGEPDRGPLWFQLVLSADRGAARELLARVSAAGFEALVLTVDAPVSGSRDRERRAGFRLPAGIAAVNLAAAPAASSAAPRDGQNPLVGGLLEGAATWRDVEWMLAESPLPLLLKGVLRADDALQAATLGVAGVIVSNHGGRTLDTAVATADALPRLAAALQGRVPLLVDGGIRRGTDVLKAVALGARAVLVGRPQVHALAVAGAHGVAHLLRLLRDELEIAMALTGCRTLADAGPWLLDGG